MKTEKKKKYKALLVRVEEDSLKKWKRLAHWNEMSMAEMIRKLMESKINESKIC